MSKFYSLQNIMKIWQRLYDYKRWFKVKILSIVYSNIWEKFLVEPYKIVEDRSYIFKNNYIVYKKEIIAIQ